MSESYIDHDVEMAQDEMFSGPAAESVPTSTSNFGPRRDRTGSITSFAYYEEDEDEDYSSSHSGTDEDLEDIRRGSFRSAQHPNEDEASMIVASEDSEEALVDDAMSETVSSRASKVSIRSHRNSSTVSRTSRSSRHSLDTPLLRRRTSADTDRSGYELGTRVSQKLYLATEDMTIVIAGFKTSLIGNIIYLLICILTAGLGALVFRWLPTWRIKLVGRPTALSSCDWVVLENQWNEMTVIDLVVREFDQPLSAVFGPPSKLKVSEYDEYDDPILTELRILDYRYIRFCFHPIRDKFVLGSNWKDPAWTDVAAVRTGLDADEQKSRQRIFGYNIIDIQNKTTMQLLVDEALHPFYMFQVASILLWSFDTYYYYAACIFFISLITISASVIDTRTTARRLREISRFECDVRVLRSGFWRYIDSKYLMPGDVYEVTDPKLTQLPCDSLLLSGDCIVNESMLTGESLPVSKIPATQEALELLNPGAPALLPEVAQHFLFNGTKIIRARRPQDDKNDEAAALALAVRTGFNTTKGSLVRSMMFPKPSGFKFYRDSFRYLSVMAGIAGLGFLVSCINFIRLGLDPTLMLVRALDLITIVVPPALPATLSIGTSFALQRLKKKLIFCLSPQRVSVGGKLDVMAFDKTGTLTEEGLDVLGVRVVRRPADRFSDLHSEPTALLPGAVLDENTGVDYEVHRSILYTMATCHSLHVVNDELVGDPLDVKMFEFTGWQLEEHQDRPGMTDDDEAPSIFPTVVRPPSGDGLASSNEYFNAANPNPVELGVLKSFEFISHLRRASVIVRQFGDSSGDVYVKGAPECMKDICLPESFPQDYDELLGHYTHRGFRVIACATKRIPKLSWLKVQKMKRDEAESELTFVGFIIFENKLKDTTTETIEELDQANIRTLMCTGDNILTAVSVARECSIISRSAHCFIPHFVTGDARTPLSKLCWESVDNPAYQLDEHTLKPLPPPAEHDASLPYDVSNIRNYSVAISGDVFRWMADYASPKLMQEMLVIGNVYARMSPDEKQELMEKLQGIDYTVGFCGDGANDCGALKAADVGISLSEAEASVAAPFTSRVFDISCVPEVIREGRAALVTSFGCFRYMSMYSAIQFISVSFLYASASNLGDFQYLYIDLLLMLPIAMLMGWSGPYPVLSKKRPTASLVSRKVLTPLMGQITLCVVTQLIVFVAIRQQPW